MSDPIADMLTRIRNAQAVSKETVVIPFSGLKYQIAKILGKEKFVGPIKRSGRGTRRAILIELKYRDRVPVIAGLKRVSKPGQRIYRSRQNIRLIRGGHGIAIISTSKGLMSDKEARKQKLGGEVICEVW